MLSHDLYEGTFARAGLATDVEVIEDFPTRYDVDARRRHRWVRGDWQLLPWILGLRPTLGGLPAVGRWKMIDNLRRSAVPPLTFAALASCLFMPAHAGSLGALFLFIGFSLPLVLPPLAAALPRSTDVHLLGHFLAFLSDTRLAARRMLLQMAFLADEAFRMLDGILRTLFRMFVTHRHLLEWTTAAQSAGGPRPGYWAVYLQMLPATTMGLALCGIALIVNPETWPLSAVFALLWAQRPWSRRG